MQIARANELLKTATHLLIRLLHCCLRFATSARTERASAYMLSISKREAPLPMM
jgi:hypothetical protein